MLLFANESTITKSRKVKKEHAKIEIYSTYENSKQYVCFCLFVLGFYGPVNNEVMSSRSVNSGTVPGEA